MMQMRLATLSLILLLGCSRERPEAKVIDAKAIVPVSMLNLIATPERYDGQQVYLLGFAHCGFEENAIYLREEDHRLRLTRNGLWLDVTPEIERQKDLVQDRYVWIIGTFEKENKGHLGLYSGAITEIRGMGVHTLADGTVPSNEITLVLP